MMDTSIDLQELKADAQQRPNFAELDAPYPAEVLALIEVAEAARLVMSSDEGRVSRAHSRLTAALAKFK